MRSRLTMLSVVVFAALGAAFLAPAHAVRRPVDGGKPDLDIRRPQTRADRAGFVMRSPTADQHGHAARLADAVPGLVLRWDGMSGSPTWLASRLGEPL